MNTVQLFCKLSVSLKFLQNKNLTKSSLGFHQPINKRMVIYAKFIHFEEEVVISDKECE